MGAEKWYDENGTMKVTNNKEMGMQKEDKTVLADMALSVFMTSVRSFNTCDTALTGTVILEAKLLQSNSSELTFTSLSLH